MPLLEKSRATHFGIRHTRTRIGVGRIESPSAWKEEVEAIKNIKTGKTKTETQSTDEFLNELKELENA